MSLVNQMLRDLEMRREREQAEARTDVQAVHVVAAKWRWPLVAAAVAIIAAGAVYAATVMRAAHRPETVTRTVRAVPVKVNTTAIAREKASATKQPAEARRASAHDDLKPAEVGRPTLARIAAVEPHAPANQVRHVDHAKTAPAPAPAPAPVQKPKPAVHRVARHAEPAMIKKPRPATPAQRAAATYAAGMSAAQAGDIVRAETEFRAALAADPTAYGAREALAALLNQQGKMKLAIQLFVTGMQADPAHRERFARAYARLLVAHNQVAQAVTILKDTLPPAAQAPEHYAFLAALEERQGQHQAAVTNYAKALAVQPAQGRWWAGLAVAYDQLREPDKALAAYQRARDAGGLGVTLATYVNQRISALKP
ncbi:MAG TPA: tetratricopeptide repeat protein [Gammaproteobacteria bacterium]|nr:tetratricopeptide repeat protein [Gammaproteobacteria bacterium]